jgi:hypothetical protein
MARIDSADKIVGSGNTAIAVGAYKDAEGNTRYKFGIRLTLPTKEEMGELWDKFALIGINRTISVKAAGMFNEKNDYGTLEDAEAIAKQFSTVEGMAEALEKAQRESSGKPKADSLETEVIRKMSVLLQNKDKDGKIATAKVPVPRADSPPKTEKGKTNYNAWAKIVRAENHPWAVQMEALVKAARAKEAKAAEAMD